jgi:hypothetical protein
MSVHHLWLKTLSAHFKCPHDERIIFSRDQFKIDVKPKHFEQFVSLLFLFIVFDCDTIILLPLALSLIICIVNCFRVASRAWRAGHDDALGHRRGRDQPKPPRPIRPRPNLRILFTSIIYYEYTVEAGAKLMKSRARWAEAAAGGSHDRARRKLMRSISTHPRLHTHALKTQHVAAIMS